MTYGRVFVPEIQDLIQRRDFKALREAMVELLPADVADALAVLNPEERAVVFRVLPASLAAISNGGATPRGKVRTGRMRFPCGASWTA